MLTGKNILINVQLFCVPKISIILPAMESNLSHFTGHIQKSLTPYCQWRVFALPLWGGNTGPFAAVDVTSLNMS